MTPEQAERYLLSLELFGMRFGLDRMRRLMTALGHPERQFDSIHVVGTNGKSSTTRMIAAILARHGLRTGTYLSPHLVSFAERIRVDDADLAPAGVRAPRSAAPRAPPSSSTARSAAGDRVTQFELLTAAAYSELAAREVEVAVIEAGLGGRYDATNVIPSKVQVLTSVGLEHTRWLGPTITDIAREKLAVVQAGGTLVLGPGCIRTRTPSRRRRSPPSAAPGSCRAGADPGVPVGAPGDVPAAQLRARASGRRGLSRRARRRRRCAAAAGEVRVPGRLQVDRRATR